MFAGGDLRLAQPRPRQRRRWIHSLAAVAPVAESEGAWVSLIDRSDDGFHAFDYSAIKSVNL
jgi:hypothetical protein